MPTSPHWDLLWHIIRHRKTIRAVVITDHSRGVARHVCHKLTHTTCRRESFQRSDIDWPSSSKTGKRRAYIVGKVVLLHSMRGRAQRPQITNECLLTLKDSSAHIDNRCTIGQLHMLPTLLQIREEVLTFYIHPTLHTKWWLRQTDTLGHWKP